MRRFEITVSIVEIDDDHEVIDDVGDFSFQIESDNPQTDIVDGVSKQNPTFSDLCN